MDDHIGAKHSDHWRVLVFVLIRIVQLNYSVQRLRTHETHHKANLYTVHLALVAADVRPIAFQIQGTLFQLEDHRDGAISNSGPNTTLLFEQAFHNSQLNTYKSL